MTDIMIKNNRLEISDGDFLSVTDVEEVKQHILVALNTFKGDWVLNGSKGINYSRGFRNTTMLENDVKKQLNSVKNVRSIDNFEMLFDKSNLAIRITAIVNTSYGKIYLDETLYNQ